MESSVNKSKHISDDELELIVFAAPSAIHGTGLFSKHDIREGEYIGTFHGTEVYEDGDHVLWIEIDEETGDQMGIEGENLLRFLNHDSPANVEFDGLDLYAIADISSGDEITLDYGDDL